MGALANIARLLRRMRGEDFLPYLAYSEEDRMFFLEGLPEGRNYAGFMWMGSPLVGANDSTVERLRSILSDNFPEGTIIQFFLLSTPDIDHFTSLYEGRRRIEYPEGFEESQIRFVQDYVRRRVEFVHRGVREGFPGIRTPVHNVFCFVCAKFPVSFFPGQEDMEGVKGNALRLQEALSAVGLNLVACDVKDFLFVMRRIFHMYDPADRSYDEGRLLRDQILYPGDVIDIGRNYLRINDTYLKIMSVKQYPRTASLAIMRYLPGDPGGVSNQITCPWMLCASIYYPSQSSETARVRSKAQTINYQAYGPLLKFIPRLAYKKAGFDVLIHSLEQGDSIVKFALELVLFGRDMDELSRNSGVVKTYYSTFQLEMAEESYITWPVFCNTLPLYPTKVTIENTKRFVTMGVRHATQFLPVLMDWKGTGTGAAVMFFTRRSEPVLVDLYDSSTNYNAIIFAESGAGKSFLSQQLIMDYLSLGAMVWVIDVGRSYEKLCRVFGGEFIELTEASGICLNPFTLVTDIDEDVELLKATVAKMASHSGELDDYLMARIEEAIKAVWGSLGHNATITNIYEYLLQQEDPRLRDLGNMLFPWTGNGSYGFWFNGECNLSFRNPLTVLELEELKGKKHLQRVVLLQLVARIQQEMFLRQTGRPKIVIIDEAWDLLDDPGTAKFMEHGYRRFRKYGGSAIIITQSLNDLYGSPNGRAILDNSAHLFILKQRPETIRGLVKENRLQLDPFWVRELETLTVIKGRYSEMFITTPSGEGIVRLIVDRYSQVLFSTSGPERFEVLRMIQEGVPASEAIERFLEEHDGEQS